MRPRSATQAPSVKSLDKALRLLRFLAEARRELGVHELARAVGVAPATAYRLLRTLEEHGLVGYNPAGARYRLGLGVLELGEAFLVTTELRQVARPYLTRLADETGETSHLMVLDGVMGVYLDRVEGPQRVRVASSVGRREHLHASAVGKAILAHLPPERRRAVVEAAGLPAFTPRTITSLPVLEAHLAEARRLGYTIDDEEGEPGIRCAGAAIWNGRGEVVAGLSVAAPAFRAPLEVLQGWGGVVREAAREVSRALGYRG